MQYEQVSTEEVARAAGLAADSTAEGENQGDEDDDLFLLEQQYQEQSRRRGTAVDRATGAQRFEPMSDDDLRKKQTMGAQQMLRVCETLFRAECRYEISSWLVWVNRSLNVRAFCTLKGADFCESFETLSDLITYARRKNSAIAEIDSVHLHRDALHIYRRALGADSGAVRAHTEVTALKEGLARLGIGSELIANLHGALQRKHIAGRLDDGVRKVKTAFTETVEALVRHECEEPPADAEYQRGFQVGVDQGHQQIQRLQVELAQKDARIAQLEAALNGGDRGRGNPVVV